MRRTATLAGACAVLGLAAVLASCGPSGNAAPPTCVAPAGVQAALVYPAPGATGIPDTFSQVAIATQGALPATFDVAIVASSNVVLFGSVLPAASPLPSPAATPPFGGPTYLTSTNPGVTFASGTTLTAQLNDLNSSCTPGTVLGTFTVQ